MLGDKTIDTKAETENRDPLTGAPGAHPVGVGLGAAVGGMAAGAAAGTVAGPVGTVVGAAVGAVLGGLAGKGVAESVDPTVEDAYWRENYASRDYVTPGAGYDDYRPAYGYGVGRYDPDRSFEDVEPELAEGWLGAPVVRPRWGGDRRAQRHAMRGIDWMGATVNRCDRVTRGL